MKISKHKNYIILFILILAFFSGRYLYRDIISPSIHQNKFYNDWLESSKVPDNWEEPYQNMKVKSSYKAALIIDGAGEYSYGKYFKYTAEKNGWQIKIYNKNIDLSVLEFDPDFIIFFRGASADIASEIRAHRSKKYLFLFSSLLTFNNFKGLISKKPPYYPTEDFGKLVDISDAVITSAKDISLYKQMFEDKKKIFNGFRMYSSIPEIENSSAEPNKLMWIGTGWDSFRNSDSFKKFIILLSTNINMKVYGLHNNLSFLPLNAYDGLIPPGLENINAIRKNGIYLLTNSNWHFKGGEPGMRIFEAVAANAIVISDKHPFAIENFGNNFLYFDQDADSETMYKQVKAHYDWIKANPEEAKAMAARAHKIFLEKFTLDKDLNRIAKMHEYILKQEKELNLSYPLAY